MPLCARHIACLPLLLCAAQALAQAPNAERALPLAPGQATPLATSPIPGRPTSIDWPEAPANGTQTSFRIRHDAADGTVVGMSLQQSRFPSLLLQVEVVPPGYGPAVESDKTHASSAPNVEQNLRTVHRVSLRYRF